MRKCGQSRWARTWLSAGAVVVFRFSGKGGAQLVSWRCGGRFRIQACEGRGRSRRSLSSRNAVGQQI